jgi:predicted ATP-grasp superfamily ATP-dependent carboligase
VTRIAIAGVSTRAAAESAVLAGFDVTSIDAFGDLDQHPSVTVISLAQDFTPRAAARAPAAIPCVAVGYLANFENHPRAIDRLARGRALWGNTADTVRGVREPVNFSDALRRHGFAVPATRLATEPPDDAPSGWLVKPLASGGGQRVRLWTRGEPLPRGCYLQELIEGDAGSIAFVAAGGGAIPIGMSRQLVGDAAFGARGYEYCGSILGAAGDPQFTRDEALFDRAAALARAAAAEFGLVGLNGIDFVARGGVPYAVEINPRWSASMELAERAYGISVLGVHASACAAGTLPDFDLRRARQTGGATGKAVVFARRDVVVGDTASWLSSGNTVRDVPHAGDPIPAGRPVCTVFATAPDAAACYDALVERAAQIYAQLDG